MPTRGSQQNLLIADLHSRVSGFVRPKNDVKGSMYKTILIVDDLATNRELIREAVAELGCEISEASTASEALEDFRYRKTALVITNTHARHVRDRFAGEGA